METVCDQNSQSQKHVGRYTQDKRPKRGIFQFRRLEELWENVTT